MREVERPPEHPTYCIDSAADGSGGGKRIQNGDDRIERFRDSAVNRLMEGACLFLEDIRDGFEGVAALE
jgi:hypothetical protein